jgi:hypothetical protein
LSPQPPISRLAAGIDAAFSGLRSFVPDALPWPSSLKAEILSQQPEPSWQATVDQLTASPGGPPPLLSALAWGLSADALLRWMCLAARLEEIVSGRKPRSAALIIAEQWLRERDDHLRYEAYRLGQAEDFATPAAMAAMATYVSGPSLAPEEAPAEPPSPGLGRSTATSVLVSAAGSEALASSGFIRVNMIGLDLAKGGDGRSGARYALAGLEASG